MSTKPRTHAARIDALETGLADVVSGLATLTAAIEALAPAEAPAKVTKARKAPAKAAKDEEFVAWLRETAPQRAARKASNAEQAAWMRSKGIQPRGLAWEAVKKGERNVRTLKALAKKDA